MPETAVVTLLFCDLVGSTDLLTSLGDDANDEVRRALLTALAQEASAHRGTVVKSAGDGMMVAFRTSAADAVACGIAMQRAASKIERGGAVLGLELRVGISSGEASNEDGDWFGMPVVESARLESAAQPGQILVSEVVRTLVGTRGGAQFRPAGTRDLKGFARPVPVVEVVWRDESTPRPVKRKTKRPRQRRTLVAGVALVAIAGAAIAATMIFVLRDSGDDNAARQTPVLLVAEGYVPKLEPRDCPTELTSDPDVRCHDLVVPETRSNPSGRQVRIFVMVAPSKAEPAGFPTVFIGGPSGTDSLYHLVNLVGVLSQPAGSDVRDYGDVVAVGVRGRQFSQPMLTCPEVSGVWRDRLALPDNGPEANKLFLDAAEQCGRRLVSEGVDLNAYGQDEIVDDVRDLAIAAGWRQINLQGSYDLARVAVRLAARYPGLVRSVVLDAPYPVDAAYYEDRLSNYNAAWQAFLAVCRADPACERAFPTLEEELSAGYAQLQQDPALVTVPDPTGGPDIGVLWNGDRLADIHLGGLSAQFNLPNIPAYFTSPPEEDDGLSRAGAGFVVLASAPDPNGDPWGANFSAYCEDLDQHVRTGNLAAAEALHPLFRVFVHDPLFELCPRWPTQEQSRSIGLLETASAVPALILSGALDPFSPPAYAQRAEKAFTHATVAVFPNLTSYVLANGPPCISALRLAFLRDPTAKLDVDGCIAQIRRIAFVGANSNGTTPTPTTVPTSTP